MKNSVPKISLLVILLVANSHCRVIDSLIWDMTHRIQGAIDGIIGNVTNKTKEVIGSIANTVTHTTNGVKQDLKNVLSYNSKVFGVDSNSKPEDYEQGLIGAWLET